MHADEVATSPALVRRLLEAQFPQWAALSIERVASAGTDNTLFRIGSDMVVRLPRRDVDVERLAKEQCWLPRLAPLLPLTVPVPLAEGRPGEGYPCIWTVYRWLHGETADRQALTDLTRAATDLAGFLLALRGIDPSGGPAPGAHNAFRGAPLGLRETALARRSPRCATASTPMPRQTSGMRPSARRNGTGGPCGSTATSTRATCSPRTDA